VGFSVKLAPGVRVRASSRGLRTSVGPRAARVHFGAGRAGFSTGAGPVGFYTSLGGNSRPRQRSSTGSASRNLALAAKVEQGKELAAALQQILVLHQPDFPAAQRPVAPPPAGVDAAAILKRHERAALAGLGLFNRSGRAEAKRSAQVAAHAELAVIADSNQWAVFAYQAELDQLWQRLLNNDPEIVLGTLAEAFEDNEAAAAPVGVLGTEASIAVLVPTPNEIPERKPALTSAGNLTLKKLTRREHADFYKLMVCGYVLVTVKEALAVAPGLTHVRVVAIRTVGPDAYGRPKVEAVLAGRIARQALVGVQWSTASATTIVNEVSDELLLRQAGASKELTALDLYSNPDIASLINAVDLTDLTG
jgi:hypothetical protein